MSTERLTSNDRPPSRDALGAVEDPPVLSPAPADEEHGAAEEHDTADNYIPGSYGENDHDGDADRRWHAANPDPAAVRPPEHEEHDTGSAPGDRATILAAVGALRPLVALAQAGAALDLGAFDSAHETLRAEHDHHRRAVALLAARDGAETALERGDPAAALASLAHARPLLIEASERARSTRFGLADIRSGAEPVTPWICEGLQWCPGRPPMIIGYPGSGKTIAMLAAAVALMLRRPVWGCLDFRPAHACRVLLADFDQGAGPTRKRVRRLLAGMQVTGAEIEAARADVAARRGGPVGELFEVESGAHLRLMADGASDAAFAGFETKWCRAVQGFDVVIIDSLRKLAPMLEENDSRFGEIPDRLRLVSERTGVTIILVHHAGRRGSDKGGGKPITETGRGSSAVDGAAGAQFVIAPDNGRRRVVLARESAEADRPPPEPFYLELVHARDTGDGRGQRIEYRTAEQATPPGSRGGEAKIASVRGNVLAALRRQTMARDPVPGLVYLAKLVGSGKDLVRPVLEKLIGEGLAEDVRETRGRGAPKPMLWALPANDFDPPPRRAPAADVAPNNDASEPEPPASGDAPASVA